MISKAGNFKRLLLACCKASADAKSLGDGMKTSLVQVSYAAVGGPGVVMRILCFFCSIISFCSSLAAVCFIWVRPLLLASVKITFELSREVSYTLPAAHLHC